jgi:branched-chain amino acid transport system substrate-binding protein
MTLGYDKVALLYENAEYPVGIKDAFDMTYRAISSRRNEILLAEAVNPNETDMRSQLAKIAQVKPQALVVLMNSAVTANAFVKQAQDLGLKLPTFGNEYFAFDVVVKNPDAKGIYATQYKYDLNGKEYVAYLSEYKETYGKSPSQDIYAAMPFDGYNVLANALEACKGDDPECVKKELYEVKNYKGITGVITIDENGDTAREFTLRKIESGRLVNAQ